MKGIDIVMISLLVTLKPVIGAVQLLGLAIPAWVLIAAGVAGVAAVSWIIYRSTTQSEPVNPGLVALLGPKESGKTLFLNWLRYGKLVEPNRTGIPEDFDFRYEHNGSVYQIKGKDISGDESMIRRFYQDLMDKSNSVMLFFNGNEFIKSKDYRKDVCRRVCFVSDHLSDKHKVFAIVATHLDKYKPEWTWRTSISLTSINSKADDAHKVITDLVSKEYPEIISRFISNMTTANLKDEDSVKLLKQRLFGK